MDVRGFKAQSIYAQACGLSAKVFVILCMVSFRQTPMSILRSRYQEKSC